MKIVDINSSVRIGMEKLERKYENIIPTITKLVPHKVDRNKDGEVQLWEVMNNLGEDLYNSSVDSENTKE